MSNKLLPYSYSYYHSIGILHMKWYAIQIMCIWKKIFQWNHIVNSARDLEIHR